MTRPPEPNRLARHASGLAPCLALAAGFILTTMPAWRPLLFGYALTLEDLLTLRCFMP